MTVNAPTLFPFRHDWAAPFTVTREWLTDVQPANDGSEVRVQLRASPNISIAMRGVFPTATSTGRLLAQWRGATQPLRYYAPLWCDATDLVTALVGGESSIDCDTTDRPFFVADGFAMLYTESPAGVVTSELVTVDVLSGTSGFTIMGTVANAYAAGPSTRVVPCRIMWLRLPVMATWVSPLIAMADLQFTDERDQAGYALSGADGTATPDTMHVYNGTSEGSSGFVDYEVFYEAVILDALGIPIPSAQVTWSTGTAGVTITPSMNSRFARVYVSAASGNITATCGSISKTVAIN